MVEEKKLSAIHPGAWRFSKYFTKHFTVEEPELDEVQCPNRECKGIFSVDFRWFKYDEDFALMTCPYCGRKIRHHV